MDWTTRDNVGPTGFGHINVNQNGSGDVRFIVVLRGAEPSTTYSILYVCVPSHEEWWIFYFGTAGLIFSLGEMTTDADGNATSGALWIEAEDLAASTCATVEANGHVDISSAALDTYSTLYGAIPNSVN